MFTCLGSGGLAGLNSAFAGPVQGAEAGPPSMTCAPSPLQVLVTAGYTGEIKVYENIGLPQWL